MPLLSQRPPQASLRKAARSLSARSRARRHSRSASRHRSSSIAGFSAKLAQQPELGHLPFPLHRIGRDLEDLGRLLHAQAPKETQLHHLALSQVHTTEPVQGRVQGSEVGVRVLRRQSGGPFQGRLRPPLTEPR